MAMDNWAPLAGFSIAFCLLLGALGTFSLLLWLTVPFTLFSIRGQLKRQADTLRRIEEGLAAQSLQRDLSAHQSATPPIVEPPRPL